MVDVIGRRAVVETVARGRVTALAELVEELGHVVAVRRPCEPGVLTRYAHACVQHHRDQEARLAFGKAEFRDGLNALIEGHFQNSSAHPPWRPPPPLRPLIRALDPP